ncbi:flagellin [Marinobacter nauticus]|jgi:Flagellin and related hook-associated proteins|uniref:Flagellin n=1 Tax=Marinobacter nauticus TaxID=2743 RepID=A0A368UPK7_MARNT|nr:flagellin [Marinobacter nauticus]RBP69289.1 flagellin [Marinobacter nauticus]RCW30768.1 flagellin [Marinobacter nauticus]
MPQIINTNIASLNAQRNLNSSQADANVALQRLSSGLRINSAKDDAAGLAISERFQSQITGLNMAQRNANDGISLAQTAEGALDEVANNLQRIRELAVQSANATNSNSDRQALNQEVQQRLEEINRIASQTSFNGLKVLDGTFRTQTFQVGANTGETIGVSGLDTRGSQIGAVIDQTQLFSELALDPTQVSGIDLDFSSAVTGDIQITLGTGAEQDVIGTVRIEDAANRDEFLAQFREQVRNNPDINGITIEPGTSTSGTIVIGNSLDEGYELSFGTLATPSAYTVSAASNATTVDEYFADGGKITFDVTVTNPETGEDVAIEVRDAVTINDIVAKVNAESNRTGVKANLDASNKNIIFSSQFGQPFEVDIEALDIGGVTSNDVQISVIGSEEVDALSADFIDISTREGADRAMIAVDYAIDTINGFRAELGAVQNRFESTIQNLSTTSENLSASNSRIRDADFAAETAELARTQVLQQAGLSVLAQANARPQQVLQLLQG